MHQKPEFKMIQDILVDNVPNFIRHIKERGGVQNSEWEWLQNPDSEIREVIDKADSKLLYEKNEEAFWQNIEILVKAISILAFLPGGIQLFNLHFYARKT